MWVRQAFSLHFAVRLLLVLAALVALIPFVALVRGAVDALRLGFDGPVTFGVWLSLAALFLGACFFLYSVKYYLATLVMLLSSLVLSERRSHTNGNGYTDGNGHPPGLMRFLRRGNGNGNGHGHVNGNGNGNGNGHFDLGYQPFVSVHIATYNEQRVIGRLLEGCAALDYENYEVIVVDDSNDQSAAILEGWRGRPRFKIIHRPHRDGFKGGALNVALQYTDPRAEFVVVWDADVVPFADSIQTFLPYFFKANGNGNGGNGDSKQPPEPRSEVAAVQSYQWHVLNKSESWLTEAVRAEYAGSYMVERPFQEAIGSLKMVAGSAYMIRADLLRKLGWGRSLTEDWELTLRLYALGFKVVYTPYAESPAECVGTFGRLARQRMRWAEGHTYNVRRHFGEIMGSSRVGVVEKVEFLFYTTYYLQAALFILGTTGWLIAELVLHAHVPEWTALLGWSLLFTNLLSLPVMNLAGLLFEEAPGKDFVGVLGALLTSFLLVPFQAYAAIKGFIEREEGPWYRTPKTGRITDEVHHLRRLKLLRRWLLGHREAVGKGRVAYARSSWLGSAVAQIGVPSRAVHVHRRLGWLVIGAIVLAVTAMVWRSASVPVVQSAGNPLYLHGTGALPCTPSTMDPVVGAQAPPCSVLAFGVTNVWSFSNLPSQTVSAGVWSFLMYWSGGSGLTADTVTVSAGVSATASCAGFVASIPSTGTWTTTFGKNSPNPTSPFTVVTSASQPALVIPAGGSLCLAVTVTHSTGERTSMDYDGTAGVDDTQLLPPSTVVPESVLGLLGLALAIPVITGRRRLLSLFRVRA